VAIDPEMVAAAKREIARAHGIDPDRAHRLVGSTAQALHADAALMAKEEGVADPTTRHSERDETGRFAPRSSSPGGAFDMNRMIREATGRA
jgi:hypothetical protein